MKTKKVFVTVELEAFNDAKLSEITGQVRNALSSYDTYYPKWRSVKISGVGTR